MMTLPNLRTTLVLAMAALTFGCDRTESPMPPEAIDAAVEGQPEIFVVSDGGMTLEGIEGLYLGQPEEDALSYMKSQCDRFVELSPGVGRRESRFKGCTTPEHAFMYSFRVGFNDRIDGRVFTLEVKRRNIGAEVVRARFTQRTTELDVDLIRPGVVRMETPDYNMFADWDEGGAGPTHILVGLSDASVAKLRSEP